MYPTAIAKTVSTSFQGEPLIIGFFSPIHAKKFSFLRAVMSHQTMGTKEKIRACNRAEMRASSIGTLLKSLRSFCILLPDFFRCLCVILLQFFFSEFCICCKNTNKNCNCGYNCGSQNIASA